MPGLALSRAPSPPRLQLFTDIATWHPSCDELN
jgi:hypothetical protein